jgi:cytochrome b561
VNVSQNRYSRVAVVLHWLVAILMIGNVVLGRLFDALPEDKVRLAIDTHKSIGITVLGLALLRLLWRAGHRPPDWPAGGIKPWEARLSHLAHGLLYLLMIGLPLSGWMHDSAWRAAAEHPMRIFGLFEWPRIGWIMQLEPIYKEHLHDLFGEVHESLAIGLYVLLGLHVAGALKHEWVDRQPTLERMSWRK